MSDSIISKQFPLILASASPRRKQLLAQLRLPFRSVTSHVNEKDFNGDPMSVSCLLAEKKACHVQLKNKNTWILGADTVVAIDDKILGKPEDEMEARRMLFLLSGKEHKVTTAICILNPSGQRAFCEGVSTSVRFIKLTDQEIQGYINTGEPYGKAGSYAIQGIGAFMVRSISGSYSNVVGLPLCTLVKALLSVGAIQRFPMPGFQR
jgi:septum formation protein